MRKIMLCLTAAAMIVACTGNGPANKAEGDKDSVKTEQKDVKPQKALKTPISHKEWSAGLPDGWTIVSQDEEGCMAFKGKDLGKALESPVVMVSTKSLDGAPLEFICKLLQKEMGAKQQNDVTIGGRVYKMFDITEDGTSAQLAVVADGDKLFSVTIMNTNVDDVDVQSILSSLKKK